MPVPSWIVRRAGGEVGERREGVAGPELGHHTESTPSRSAWRTNSTAVGSERHRRRCRRAASWRRLGELLDAFDGALHVGLDLAEPPAQHPGLLAGVVGDRHRRARRARSHDVAEPQAGAGRAAVRGRSATGRPGLSGSEVRQPNARGSSQVSTKHGIVHSPIAACWLRPWNTAPTPRSSLAHSAPANSSENRAGRLMSETSDHTVAGEAAMSTSTMAPGPSSKRSSSPGPRSDVGAEAVEVGDRPGGVAWRAAEVGALRVRDREQDDLGHVLGDAEDLLDPRRRPAARR